MLTQHDIQQPIVRGQPTATGEIPVVDEPPKLTRKRPTRKKPTDGNTAKPRRTTTTRRKKP